jgi:Uncharacterized protein conserved in bacteria (DUF2213)
MKRVHILSAVNAANVSKAGSVYTIRDVCGAVDGIVMNSKLYPADELAKGVATLEGKPAPAGHPKNAAGQHISALNGEALASAWIGSYARNARHVGGRTLCDVVVNEAQAKAHPIGAKLVDRLDAAINGTNTDPIHVSTGLFHDLIAVNGESNGKAYQGVVTNIRYDHLAILVDGKGAATPADGVGLFLNEAGQPEEIETVTVNTDPEDKRSAGLLGWIRKLVGNGSTEPSFDQITALLYAALPKGAWLREVYARHVIWADESTGAMYRQDYSVASDGASVAFAGQAVEVVRKVEYEPITNRKEDPVKDTILAALNAAGIATAGLTDAQALDAYNTLQVKPVKDQLTAANSKLAEIEIAANAAANAELTTLATELAANSKGLTVADFRAMGADRCKELKATASTAAPVIVGNAAAKGAADDFATYSINKTLEA